ncbi:35916_t:CDS:2, partial [Racocetra persica]
ALYWVNKPEAIELFEFFHSLLKLSDWHTNVRNKHLLGAVIITSEGRPYVWKAIDISLECETYVDVIEKINLIFTELSAQSIKAIAVVTDSAEAYAAT